MLYKRTLLVFNVRPLFAFTEDFATVTTSVSLFLDPLYPSYTGEGFYLDQIAERYFENRFSKDGAALEVRKFTRDISTLETRALSFHIGFPEMRLSSSPV